MLDGTYPKADVRGVAAAGGAVGETLEVAIPFSDSCEASEECVGIVEQVVDLMVQAAIEGGQDLLCGEDRCVPLWLSWEEPHRVDHRSGRH